MSAPDTEVRALVHEREGYARSGNAIGVSLVDEQLRLRGWMVDARGELAEFTEKPKKRPAKERAVKAPAPERAVDGD